MRNAVAESGAARLPLVLGVTGHRDPLEPDRLRGALRELFLEIRTAAPNTPVILLSPLAAGCDQLFAEVGLECLADGPGVELFVPMPFELEDYRCDFEGDVEGLAGFESLRSRATACFALPSRRPADLVDWSAADGRVVRRVLAPPTNGEPCARDLHYDRLGRFIAAHSHIVFALWNGREAEMRDGIPQQVGGTAAVVRYCRHGDGHEVGRGVPLHEDLSTLAVGRRVPVAVVPCRRKRDTDPGTPEEWAGFDEGAAGDPGGSALRRAMELASLGRSTRSPVGELESTAVSKGERAGAFVRRADHSDFHIGLRELDAFNHVVEGGLRFHASAEEGAAPKPPVRWGDGPLAGWFRRIGEWTAVLAATVLYRCCGFVGLAKCEIRLLDDLGSAFVSPIDAPHVHDSLRMAAEAHGDDRLDATCRHRLLELFERLDRRANLETIRHRRSAVLATLFLLVALVAFQVFGAFSGDYARAFVLVYLLAMLGYLAWARRIKRCEERRALARSLAELARVQLAWRVAGVKESVVDSIPPRRRALLGRMPFLIGAIELYAVLPPPATTPGGGEVPGLRAVRDGWIEDQWRYCALSRGVDRKRRKRRRRECRLRFFKGLVIVVAGLVSALVIAGWIAGDLLPGWLSGELGFALVELTIGLSLVLVLLTEFRASIALDREDAEAADNALGLYDTARRQVDDRLSAADFEGVRRIVRELGACVVDEQIEWYIRHRDSAAVDAVG